MLNTYSSLVKYDNFKKLFLIKNNLQLYGIKYSYLNF